MIELIPLSAETVKRRIDDVAIDCKEQLLNEIRACDNFSIQLNESTTISSEAFLLIDSTCQKVFEILSYLG